MTVRVAQDLPTLSELVEERFARDPGVAYRAAHAHPGPGLFRMPTGDGLIATAHKTLVDLMHHPALEAQHRRKRRAGAGAEGALARMDSYSPFFMNEPAHTPIAIATYRPMSPARTHSLVETIAAVAERAVDDMLDRGGVVDLRRDYARVIARDFWARFLGLPAEAGPLLDRCSATIVPMLNFENTPEEVDAANRAAQSMRDYLEAHHEMAGDSPGETFCHLFESALADSDWSDVTRSAATTAAAITFDGIDSAAGGTANVIYTCLNYPDQWALMEENPGLAHDAWREAIRLEPPFFGLHRGAHDDIEYEGVRIAAGANLLMAWGAANRDPRVFENPDRFDIRRPKRRTLGFGGGPRICKGRHLAMLEGEIALRVLLERLASIELLVAEPDWGGPGMVRTIQAIPARLTAR
ncbi:MAG: cytochrome P450 [Rhodospirillaceae bacterium]|nr:cytochrome P450 [Rhodospirillaceae bacterium]